MLSSNETKKIRSLSEKKFRDREGLFVVEGEKMVEEALRSGFKVERVVRLEEAGEAAMRKASALSSVPPVLAVVHKPQNANILDDIGSIKSSLPKKGLLLALDAIRDPGNLGTIIRVADWFGVDAVYASPDTVDIFNPKVVQATMGSIFRVCFRYAPIALLCDAAMDCGGKVYGTFLDGDDIYSSPVEISEETPTIVVIGNEADGISMAVEEKLTGRLRIPPYPESRSGAESLNAAVATAITLAELRRRATRH